MGTKQLTLNQKTKFTPIIVKRDFPNGQILVCFFCEQRFIESNPKWKRTFDHLDNNTTHNFPENLVFAHWHCNQKKKFNPEWQVLANDKLQENLLLASESLGEGRNNDNADKNTQPNEQIDANKEACKLVEEYLIERLLSHNGKDPVEKELDFHETSESLSYIYYKKYTHGSQNTFDRILKMFTSKAAPFDRDKRDGRMKIFRRCGQ